MHRLLDAGFSYAGFVTITPDPKGLAAARRKVRSVVTELNFNEDDADDLLIAVGEAISNAYLYGTSNRNFDLIHVGWYVKDQTLTFVVKDCGRGFHSASHVTTSTCSRGLGCGIKIMSEVVDDLDFEYDGGTRVALHKHHSQQAPQDVTLASALG